MQLENKLFSWLKFEAKLGEKSVQCKTHFLNIVQLFNSNIRTFLFQKFKIMKKEYQKEDMTIVWDNSKCIHSGICAKGLSSVFKPKEQPWIQTDGADKETIRQQVLACPSGALSIKD